MFLYLSIIGIAIVIISVLNIVFVPAYPFDNYAIWITLATVGSTIVEIVIQLIVAGIIENLPNRWFKKDGWIYACNKKESLIYEKLQIKSWKDRVPELGALGGFRKNKIKDPNDPAYIGQFIVEAKKGIVVHITCNIIGFLVIFILPLSYWWRIGLPVYIVSIFLNTLPIMILRYNVPKLKVVEKRAIRNASRRKSNENVSQQLDMSK